MLRHNWCVYNAIGSNRILDFTFVNSNGIVLIMHDAKQFRAARQGLEVCVGNKVKCFLIFGSHRWMLIENDRFTWF